MKRHVLMFAFVLVCSLAFIIKRVTPTRGAPGTLVNIECDGFHINDEIEIIDADGHPVRFDSGGSSVGTGFGIPKDATEGVLTVRIGNPTYMMRCR